MQGSFKMAAVAVAGWALVGCGGGGGDVLVNPVGEPLAINSSNYITVAQEVLAASLGLVDTSEVLVGTQVVSLTSPVAYARSRLPQLMQPGAAGVTLVSGTVHSETYYCSGGGTIVATFDDRDENYVLSSGDSVAETYNNCVEANEVANGEMHFGFNQVSGDLDSYYFTASITLSMVNFRVSSLVSSDSVLGNGTMTLSTTSNGLNNQHFKLDAPSYREDVNYAGMSSSRTLTNYFTDEVRTPTFTGYTSSATFGGTLTSSALGGRSVSVVTTLPPFGWSEASVYPTAGQAVATGAAGSNVRMTALSGTTVQMDLDADGNGIIDDLAQRLWSDFL